MDYPNHGPEPPRSCSYCFIHGISCHGLSPVFFWGPLPSAPHCLPPSCGRTGVLSSHSHERLSTLTPPLLALIPQQLRLYYEFIKQRYLLYNPTILNRRERRLRKTRISLQVSVLWGESLGISRPARRSSTRWTEASLILQPPFSSPCLPPSPSQSQNPGPGTLGLEPWGLLWFPLLQMVVDLQYNRPAGVPSPWLLSVYHRCFSQWVSVVSQWGTAPQDCFHLGPSHVLATHPLFFKKIKNYIHKYTHIQNHQVSST